jgi:ABC-type sulfate transport system permease component
MGFQPLLILALAFVAIPIAVRVFAAVCDRIERWIANSRFKDTFKHVS